MSRNWAIGMQEMQRLTREKSAQQMLIGSTQKVMQAKHQGSKLESARKKKTER